MSLAAALFVLATVIPAAGSLNGLVTGPDAQPVVGARVFIEPGLGGSLIESTTAGDGSFRFDAVPSGLLGIFAVAEGLSYGGLSHTLAPDENVENLSITLRQSGAVSGKVLDMKGQPVSGAHVASVLLLGPNPVGIPLAKLAPLGFDVPASNDSGQFTVPSLPAGATVALKVTHSAYAQSTQADIAVGSSDARITLYPGVTVEGTVLSRDGSAAVANASVILRNATPPHDTAVTKTDLTGEFSIKLNPGIYLYQAASVALRSPGWERLNVSGREPVQRVALRVAGTARLHGEVRDAKSGEPIAGARIALAAFGSPAEVVTTGTTGTYDLTGAEGENVIRIEPAPGYSKPAEPYLTVQATQGQSLELPTFWLTALPSYSLLVVDEQDNPVSGGIIRVVRPDHPIWYTTDSSGRLTLPSSALPEDGRVVGFAEHPAAPTAAVFAIDAQHAESARVKLLPMASIEGRVVTTKTRPVESAAIGGLYQANEEDEALQLWRTYSNGDGRFQWDAVPAYVPMACLASTGADTFGRSMPFTGEPGAHRDLGNVVITDSNASARSSKSKSLLGKKLDVPGAFGRPMIVLYAVSRDAAVALSAMESAHTALALEDLTLVLVVDGATGLSSSIVSVSQGKAPGLPTAYLVNGAGEVVLETSGIPPAVYIRRLRGGGT